MKKVRWGVLGTAGIARSCTIPAMKTADSCELYAIAGRSLEKAWRFAQEFGFEKAYGSYDELLADPGVEAVYIPLPNDIHYEWVVRALNAKKHVLCEKPLALNAGQAAELFRIAEANGVYLMEAFAYQHSPIVSALKQVLDSGVIGEVRYLESAFLGGLPKAGDYRWNRDAGGGAVYDLGCYAVSMALRLMGREPETVRAAAQFAPQGIDLFTSALLLYDDESVAALDCGMLLPRGRLDRFRLHGTLGEIVSPVEFNQQGNIPYTVIRDGARETKTVHTPNNYSLEAEQMSRCILLGEAPAVSRDFSLMNARVMDRILREIGY